MGVVTTVGVPLSTDQKEKLKAEVYAGNSGPFFGQEELMQGLEHASELLTDALVAAERAGPSFVQTTR